MGRTYLVTGAAGGVGRLVVLQLRAKGHVVIAAARRTAAMADLAEAGAKLVAMDVSDTESVKQAFEQADGLLAGMVLDGVIHCAAVAPLGTVEFAPPHEFGDILNTNTLGALRILQAALPRLRRARSGRLVLISSLWGRMAGPLVSNYSASKYAVEAIADSARREIGKNAIRITVMQAGVVATAMFQNQLVEIEQRIAKLSPKEHHLYASTYRDYASLLRRAEATAISADACARAIVRCLEKGRPKPRYRIGIDAKIAVSFARFLPDALIDRLFALSFRRSSPQTPMPD